MPKFEVTLHRTHIDELKVPVDAPSQADALNAAEDMIKSGNLEGWQPAGSPSVGVANCTLVESE